MAGKPGRNMKHGHTRRADGNSKGTLEYRIWLGMRRRCDDPKSTPYPHYGARGIRVCDRWQDFSSFLADMGNCPVGCSIDRINPDGNYEPGNCRWATKIEQARNQRGVKLSLEAAATMRSMKSSGARTVDIARAYGVHKSTVERVLSGQRWSYAAIDTATKNGGSRGE